jgi:FKBP-type peptidyl-prolyl cis-trans isomerase FkpA
MKSVAILAMGLCTVFYTKAQAVRNGMPLDLPDSVKAVALIATVQVPAGAAHQTMGIMANGVSVALQTGKAKHTVQFSFPDELGTPAKGLEVTATFRSLTWSFKPKGAADYRLLLASAGDSADNFMLYSGYIYLPQSQKWKLIGTCHVPNQWTTLKQPMSFSTSSQKHVAALRIGQLWCQRSSGSWKPLVPTDAPPPVLPPFSSIDSARQFALDSAQLAKDMAAGRTDVRYQREGVYTAMLQEGTGKQVALTDTVSVFYKGYLYANGKVFDQTKDKPARFPLARLIKGWQIGLPLCKVGGKIKLVILSGQAYAIRTRAAKIPPNSILVFEIEVVGS